MGGGAQGSSTVSYHDSIMQRWTELTNKYQDDKLDMSAWQAINDALYKNPYDSREDVYDPNDPEQIPLHPDSILSDMSSYLLIYYTYANSVNPEGDYVDLLADLTTLYSKYPSIDITSGLTTAIENALQAALDATLDLYVQDVVDANEQTKTPRYMRSLARFASGMGDINAVHSSAFVIGMAIMETEFLKEINEEQDRMIYDTTREIVGTTIKAQIQGELNQAAAKDAVIPQMASGGIQMLQAKLAALDTSAKVKAEVTRMQIVALKEYLAERLEVDRAEAMWDINTLKEGGNIIASLPGGVGWNPSVPKQPSALGGALSGAAAGAMAGSMIPVPGASIAGAVIGGIGGLLS
jgi:hypothetical protein